MISENETFVRLQGSLSFNCGRKNFDRMDFLDANRLRVENGRNPSVQP